MELKYLSQYKLYTLNGKLLLYIESLSLADRDDHSNRFWILGEELPAILVLNDEGLKTVVEKGI